MSMERMVSQVSKLLRCNDLTLAGFANANRLVADDPQREERRSVLKEKKSRLEQAGERIGAMHRDFFMNNAITVEV